MVLSENVIELHADGPQLELAPRSIDPADWARFGANLGEILEALGLPPDTPGTRETPERFLRALYDATAGYEGDPKLLTAFPSEAAGRQSAPGQVVEGPISFCALCEHHALPFHGHAYVGYVPGEQIIGISKLTRLVRLFARRFTVQERMGEQIADTLVHLVDPRGVAVYLEASHMCTEMRGVEERSRTTTTFWRGVYEDAELRREFLGFAR
jgi:GTP cyclohydrolase I